MKKIILALIVLSISLSMFSQVVISEEGIYYTSDYQLFSGKYSELYPKGTLKMECNILNGKLDGETIIYSETGSKIEIRSYKNGLMHGKWLQWNENGKLIAEANYVDNLKDGKWFIWDENGILRYEMNYFRGKKFGIWIMRNEKNEIISKKEF